MNNLDELKKKSLNIQTRFCKALKEDDAEGVAKAFDDYGEMLTAEFKKAFNDYKEHNDAAILEKAGIKQYTSAEKKAFQGIIDAAKDANVGISVPAAALPNTFITRLLNEIVEESPLLNAVNITNVGFLATMILDDSEDDPATWTGMGETISEMNVSVRSLQTNSYKLAKIIYVPNEMLDMGPEWVMSFTERKLRMSLRLGLETGIVSGSGAKCPIGMNRTLKNGTAENGEYSKKTAVAVTSFKAREYGELIAKMVVNSKGKVRSIEKVIIVAHPETILTKIMPATTVRRPDGTYSEMCFPFPTEVISSVAVAKNEGVLGIYKKYELYIGTGTNKEGNIIPDKSIAFREHMTAIKIYMYGNGSFVDENDNILLDLSNLETSNMEVKIVNSDADPVITKATGAASQSSAG